MVKIRAKRIEKLGNKVLNLINKTGFTPRELFLFWVALGWDIGQAIHGKLETIEDLEKMYYTRPALGTAMMLQSKIASSWLEDLKTDGQKEPGATE